MMLYYLSFIALLIAIAACTVGVVRAALHSLPSATIPFYALSLVVGIPLFLVLFSLIARAAPPYHVALPLTLLLLYGAGRAASRNHRPVRFQLTWADRICMSFFGVSFVVCYLLRTYWPAIHWENSAQRIGVERMFNLSLQQSFLHARGWPVDNLWLYGEPLDYHVLLRALPGLTSWLVRVVSGDAMSGGVIYLLTDALYLTLAPTAVIAFLLIILPLLYPQIERSKLAVLSVMTALLAFLTPNGKALWESLRFTFFGSGSNDFWQMQHAVVPGTVSYFPFGLLLSGESHSYAQAPFLSVTWLGLTIVYVAGTKNVTITILLAALGAMITQSHPATAMVCALVSLPLLTWDALMPFIQRAKAPWRNMAHSAAIVLIAGALLVPMYLEHLPPEMKWVLVSQAVVSTIWPFVCVHLYSVLSLALAAIALGITRLRSTCRIPHTRTFLYLAAIALCALGTLQRPIISLMILYVGVLSVVLGSQRPVPILALLGAALLWVFPEIAVTDWIYDNRTDWIRFNTAMRLWLESTYIVPATALLIAAPEVSACITNRRAGLISIGVTTCFSACVLVSLYTLTSARMDRAPERTSIDGYTFLRDEHPRDFELVSYLNQIPGRVVVGEACGDGSHPQLPYHYGMPGRISAFSGRPSLCGWARHTWMFQRRLRRANIAHETIWQSFLTTGASLKSLYLSSATRDTDAIKRALAYLQQRGVTHLVIGELESAVYPGAEPQSIAQMIGGRVVFNPAPGVGIVELPAV